MLLIFCAAKIFSNLGTFYCGCDRNFQRKVDLKRLHKFCWAINMSLVREES